MNSAIQVKLIGVKIPELNQWLVRPTQILFKLIFRIRNCWNTTHLEKKSKLHQRLPCSHDFKILHGGRIIECDAHYFAHQRLQFPPYVSTLCMSTRYLFHEIAKCVFSISCQPCLFYSAVKIVFYSTRSQFWQALKVAPDMWSWRKTHHLKALWLLFTVFALKQYFRP